MKNRITELLEQIQKDFQTSSENIGKIKGLLEDEDKGITIEFPSLKPGRKFHIINDSDREVTVEGNPNGTVTIKPGETKKFPESAPEINSYEDACAAVSRNSSCGRFSLLPDHARDVIASFEKKIIIAEAFGGDTKSWLIDFRPNWKFPSPEMAKKYRDLCLKEGLL